RGGGGDARRGGRRPRAARIGRPAHGRPGVDRPAARPGRPRHTGRAGRSLGFAMLLADVGLAELHTHLGGSVASDTMWSLAHEQGIALPVKDYWEFDKLVTVSDPRG